MARVNIDADIEGHEEFWALLPLVGNDRDVALGKLVRFFRLAQSAYAGGAGIAPEELEAKGLRCMVESGWAVADAAGRFHAKGEDKHFAWYRQKKEAGKRGGRPAKPEPENRQEPGANRPVISENPLALAPVLAPAPVPKKREEAESPLRVQIDACGKTWTDSLSVLGIKNPSIGDTERGVIGRAIQIHGAERVDLALYGARFEKPFDGFNPKEHASVTRVLERDKRGQYRLDKFVNLGAQAKAERAAKAKPVEAPKIPDNEPPADPERVRAIMAQYGLGRRPASGVA